MTCLNWKSDAHAAVIRPLPKGNGISALTAFAGYIFLKARAVTQLGLFLAPDHAPDPDLLRATLKIMSRIMIKSMSLTRPGVSFFLQANSPTEKSTCDRS